MSQYYKAKITIDITEDYYARFMAKKFIQEDHGCATPQSYDFGTFVRDAIAEKMERVHSKKFDKSILDEGDKILINDEIYDILYVEKGDDGVITAVSPDKTKRIEYPEMDDRVAIVHSHRWDD